MAGRGRPKKYLKNGVLHKMDSDRIVKGYYINCDEKKKTFQFDVSKNFTMTKDRVLDLISRDKKIDIYAIVDLSFATVTNVNYKREIIED